MRDYWSIDAGLGNFLIQKTMTRNWFLEILLNLHFAYNLQKLPPKESERFDCAWKLRPFLDHLLKHFQEALLLESHQSIDEDMCKFKEKSLMCQYMKNTPIKLGFKFWFRCGSESGYLYQFDMYLRKKSKTKFGVGESVVLSLCENLKKQLLHVLWQLFYKSKSHAKAIWGWNLCNWNRQIKLEAHAHFEKR